MQDPFWNKHYKSFSVHEPTRFAQHCLTKHLHPDDTLIELGCGNGRDGLSLAQMVSRYVGIDVCPVATEAFRAAAIEMSKETISKIEVVQGDFTSQDFRAIGENAKRLVLYSRFSFHSITYAEADRLFKNIAAIDTVPWVFLLEARTIWDSLYGEGMNIGLHEFQTDHYRRFIDPDSFLGEVASRFSIRYFEVAPGFSPFGDQDPIVMRTMLLPRSA